MSRRFFFAIPFALACVVAIANDLTISIEADDPRMRAAISRARNEVPRLITEMVAGNKDVSVKVAIDDHGRVEYFWLKDIEYLPSSESFRGKIDNDPESVHTVVLGQVVTVSKASISDWLYISNGRMFGNYTLRVLLPKMPALEAEKARKWLSDE
jgi:uncharacterized protein YegJ (DUF2314 family)